MFVSVSDGLPKTSYIKMVDIWLITSLSIPFFEVKAWTKHTNYVILDDLKVILHTAIDSYRVDENRTVNHHGQVRRVGSHIARNNFIEKNLNDNGGSKMVRDYGLVQRYCSWTHMASSIILDERDESKKVNAIREFYNKRAINDETIVVFLTSFGKYGIPSIFFIFTIVYWTTGILKYFWTWNKNLRLA